MNFLDRIRAVGQQAWHPVGAAAFGVATVLVAVVAYFANTGERWVMLLDSANLALHEAGHPLFGLLLGERMAVYGGTFMQLIFPMAATLRFWQRRESVSFALCVAWSCENLWNIARYMADARARVLPLVGGGEHDWTEIFSRWGVLHKDLQIAGWVTILGWAGILAVWGWLGRRWLRDRVVHGSGDA